METCVRATLRYLKRTIILVSAVSFFSPAFAVDIDIPGSADIGRQKPTQSLPVQPDLTPQETPHVLKEIQPPAQASQTWLRVDRVEIRGVTAFDVKEFTDFYKIMLNRYNRLDTLWEIASNITKYYQDHGYFLSRAYIPVQSIDKGVIIIQVVEGYIGQVDVPDILRGNHLVENGVQEITSERPLNVATLESVLLRLNEFPGMKLRSIMEPLKDADGVAKLTLVREDKPYAASVQLNNYGTRYAGPVQSTLSYQGEIIPGQDTSVYGLASLPMSELKYGGIQQRIPISMDVDLILMASHTKSEPGFHLRDYDVKGDSTNLSIGFNYSVIRQRQENLLIHMALDARNSNTDILNTALARDRVRAARIGARYNFTDGWNGTNTLDVTLSRGISGLGANDEQDINLSRGGAKPDFTKGEVNLSHWQELGSNFNMLFSAAAQRASGILYSSEEIGFGGQLYGRAYDSSEITGNHGLMAMAEVRYNGFEPLYDIQSQPFVFYDVGKVWSENLLRTDDMSAASSGFGMRLGTPWHISNEFTVAFPLTRPASAPPFGGGMAPRYLARISIDF